MTASDQLPAIKDPFSLMDQLDTEAILAELEGQLVMAWVYEIKDKDGKVTQGLSAKGVEGAARYMATKKEILRELEVKLESETEREARFLATAGRFALRVDADGNIHDVLLDSVVRGKRESKYRRRRDGREEFNPHWYETGVTKAARNAKLALIDEKIAQMILKKAIRQGRVTRASIEEIQLESRPPFPDGAPRPLPQPEDIKNAGDLFSAALMHLKMQRSDVLKALGVSHQREIDSPGSAWATLLELKQEPPDQQDKGDEPKQGSLEARLNEP